MKYSTLTLKLISQWWILLCITNVFLKNVLKMLLTEGNLQFLSSYEKKFDFLKQRILKYIQFKGKYVIKNFVLNLNVIIEVW